MAQGRILSKSIATDPDFNQMSSQAQLLYLKAIPHLDRDGLITGHPSRLWALVDPFHAEVLSQMGRSIQEWVDANLILRYDTGREPVLFFTAFRKHNANIRYDHEPASLYPPPPGWLRTAEGIIPEDEDLIRHLVHQFDPRSAYRQLLLRYLPENANAQKNVATLSRQSHDDIVRLSRDRPDKDNTTTYDDDDGTYIPSTPPSLWKRRGVRGETEPPAKTAIHPPLNFPEFPDHILREAAWVYGELLYPGQWHGYHQYLRDLAPDGVVLVLEWIKHFMDATTDEIDNIRSIPSLIKWHVNKRNRPGLALQQRKELINMVADVNRNPQPERWQ